ncbi:hypothetical protein CYY_000979 [Polysphondylium violaceum]|uniref:MACPF domain-containing protein n=1 Tax=Polysphondylium violaceum TaxID=133409 RepID=A0A8J4V8E2_9MYCE|nr:hypothetical protein CYY_000979 [Polysphondylium violaceum]
MRFLLFLSLLISVCLEASSTCVSNCGSHENPFKTFKEAISEISKYKLESGSIPYLIVKQGDYFGIENKGINITIDINIVSTKGSSETTLDCQNAGKAFNVEGPISFSLTGFTIKGCTSGRGGAIYSKNLMTNIEDIAFIENNARLGSAIYSTSSVFNIEACMFYNNNGGHAVHFVGVSSDISNSQFNMNSNDVFCENGNIVSSNAKYGSICVDCSILSAQTDTDICGSSKSSIQCNSDGICQKWIENYSNCPSDCPYLHGCIPNGICNEKDGETFTNCPMDCDPKNQTGWILDSYDYSLSKPIKSMAYFADDSKKIQTTFIPFSDVRSFMAKKYDPVSGRLTTNVIVPKDGDFFFRLTTENIGAIVFVNGRVLFDTFFPFNIQKEFNSERKMLMVQNVPTFVEIVFISHSSNERNIALEWRHETESEYQPIPSTFISYDKEFTCGDNVCNEIKPETCLIDCYAHIEKKCPGQSPPAKLQDFYGNTDSDIVGKLLNNQYIFSLPGMSYMSHAIDIRTGVPNTSPLFDLSYCDNTSFSIVQDPYRGLVYSVPKGLFAQASPKCTMDSTTKTYSNSAHMSKEESQDMSLDVSASGGGGCAFVQVSVSASLSLSQSTKSAKDTETKKDGSLSKTTISCETTKVHLVEPRFHPKFIEDVSNCYVKNNKNKTNENLQKVIQKYGSTYMTHATMGGKLEVITSVDHSFSSNKTSSEVEKAMEMSVSAQVSSKVLSGSASATLGRDSKTTSEEQSTFESNSERSTVQIYGGEPGSYGMNEPNAFATWAKTVDLVPYPIKYKAGYVADILPDSWFFEDGHSVKLLWLINEWKMFKSYLQTRNFKYIDYDQIITQEEELQEQHLQRNDTTYHLNCSLLANFDLEITNSKYKTFYYSNVPSFDGSNPRSNIVISYNDTKGIFSMAFTTKTGASLGIKNVTSPDGSIIYYDIGQSFDIYNIFSSRYYHMVLHPNGTYIISNTINPKSLVFKFNQLTITRQQVSGGVGEGSGTINGKMVVMVYGSLEKEKIYIPLTSTPEQTYTFRTNNDYIGQVLGLSFRYETDQNDPYEKNILMKYESLIVLQACGKESSHCIPKNNYFDENLGLVLSYESWRKETGQSLITVPHENTAQWETLEQLGS